MCKAGVRSFQDTKDKLYLIENELERKKVENIKKKEASKKDDAATLKGPVTQTALSKQMLSLSKEASIVERNFRDLRLEYDTNHRLGEGASVIIYKGNCSRDGKKWSCAVKVERDNKYALVEYMIAGTRPESLNQSIVCDTRLQVEGFTKEGISEYIDRYFGIGKDGKEKLNAFKLCTLLDSPSLLDACPFVLNLVCSIVPQFELDKRD